MFGQYKSTYLFTLIFLLGCDQKISLSESQSTFSKPLPSESFNPKSDRPTLAPNWLLSLEDHGQWADDTDESLTHLWVDCQIANIAWEKYPIVEMVSEYESGEVIHIQAPMIYKGKLGENDRWGTDALEIYRKQLSSGEQDVPQVTFRIRLQLGLGSQAGIWHS